MREILFRGKCKEDGEWIDGNLIINHNYCNNKIEYCSIYSMDIVDANGSYCGYDFVEIEPKTVGQYTGLTDKNGKKIFEGDIILISKIAPAKVFYNEEDACYAFDYGKNGKPLAIDLIDDTSLEVIGNIYDNPELLEVEDA